MSMDPFEILMDIERKCKQYAIPLPREKEVSELWQGIGYLIKALPLVTPVSEIKEVLVVPDITPLPASVPWFLGVANFRGHVLPITDLQGFLFGTPQAVSKNSRILVVSFEKTDVGFLVQQMVGVQHVYKKEVQALTPTLTLDEKLTSSFQGSFIRENTSWSVLSLKALTQTAQFYHVVSEMEKTA